MTDPADMAPHANEGMLRKAITEVTQPFIDLVHAPRALWGVNLAYTIEGLCYFGMLTYLAIHFSDFIFKGVEHADVWSHEMVMVLTAGIAIAMVVLGFVPDKWGIRRGLIASFVLLLAGRVIMSAAPTIWGLQPDGLWSALHILTMAGILLVVVGYGIYQPAAYAAVRQFTTPKTASMAYAMLYALMNLGSSLAMLAFLLRDEKFVGLGISGTFWVYTGLTLVSLLSTIFILSKKTAQDAIASVKAETIAILAAEKAAAPAEGRGSQAAKAEQQRNIPITAWIVLAGILAAILLRVPDPWRLVCATAVLLAPAVIAVLPGRLRGSVIHWVARHPLADPRFFFFIFALMPVQTLFTYNWLVLPQYISRAFAGWIGEYFEVASNANPVLIFILVPIITALTYKADVYKMMIWGTLVMGSSAFILALGPTPAALVGYILCMTIGEAMWSARFLQYATEIAPPDRAGLYQGVAQLPWFLTKFLVPLLYSGQMMERYCPSDGQKSTEMMWFIFGLIAVITPLALWLARGWMIKSFKVKHQD
jgi:proton-dependent oligopeptide transporter, POT family